jgi:flagellar biosynthesis protein FliQ
MTISQVRDLGLSTMILLGVLSGPVLLASMVVGLAVSLMQAVTSIQEQTLSFVPKLLAVFVVLLLCIPFMSDQLIHFSIRIFGNLGEFAH